MELINISYITHIWIWFLPLEEQPPLASIATVEQTGIAYNYIRSTLGTVKRYIYHLTQYSLYLGFFKDKTHFYVSVYI